MHSGVIVRPSGVARAESEVDGLVARVDVHAGRRGQVQQEAGESDLGSLVGAVTSTRPTATRQRARPIEQAVR